MAFFILLYVLHVCFYILMKKERKKERTLSQVENIKPKEYKYRLYEYYYFGSRKGRLLFTRIRTSSSSLNHRLFFLNIADKDIWLCSQVEDTRHVFLTVPCLFVSQRQVMMNRSLPLCNPTLDMLLFGDSTITYQVNANINSVVQDYIIRTKRFV